MDKTDTRHVITYIAGAYPKFYSSVTERSLQGQIATWADLLQDYDINEVMAGVRGFISADCSGFPPTPGQIIEYMHKVTHPVDKSGVAAWALVRRAVNSPRDQYEAAFDALPELIQETLGGKQQGVAQLQAWGSDAMTTQSFETVVQSNFLRSYDATQKRLATEQKMPKSVLALRGEVLRRLESKTSHPEKAPETATYEAVEAPVDRMAQLRRRLGGE